MSNYRTQQELCGGYKVVPCICDICKRNHSKSIPIEHTESEYAFKLNGRFVINCDYCNNAKKYGGR